MIAFLESWKCTHLDVDLDVDSICAILSEDYSFEVFLVDNSRRPGYDAGPASMVEGEAGCKWEKLVERLGICVREIFILGCRFYTTVV